VTRPEVQQVQLPLEKSAFDHPATRDTWVRARRRVRWGLAFWSVLLVVLFIGVNVLGELDAFGSGKAKKNVVGGVPAVAFLCYLCILYLRVGSLRCLRRIRDVLRAEPWQPIPAAHREPGVKDVAGVAVRLRLTEEAGEEWTGLKSARNPVQRRRWPQALEQGAWYAGDVAGRGVLALPGGGELMEIETR
jgi:hypothetical protein